MSASFLFLIGALNLVILGGIFRVFRSMRRGTYDEAELERQLQNRGFMSRFFGRWMRAINHEWQIYPVGVVFGMGFDTATEVALLATTALLATQHLPFYAILCLPILFTAGMCLMDTLDGIFMNFAYSWAFLNPVRKIYYNLAITGLSVAICFVIATIEVLGLLPTEIGGMNGGFWDRWLIRHQQGRLCDRRDVRRLLGGSARVLEVRAGRGEVGRPGSPRRRRESLRKALNAPALRRRSRPPTIRSSASPNDPSGSVAPHR